MKRWYNRINVIALMLILLLFINSSMTTVLSDNTIKVLSICTNVEDVLFTNNLVSYLEEQGLDIAIRILYLGGELGETLNERSLLNNMQFLRSFDEIWLFDVNTINGLREKLRLEEIINIAKVVYEGRIVVIGMNTYIQNYVPILDNLLGIRLLRYYTPLTGEWTIKGLGIEVNYDAIKYSIIEVQPITCSILAFFYPKKAPAITINIYGKGVAVFLAFNPVKQAIEHTSHEVYEIVGKAIINSMDYLVKKAEPPLHEKLIRTTLQALVPIAIAVTVTTSLFGVLGLQAYMGLLPYSLTSVIVMPGAMITKKSILRNRKYFKIYKVIRSNPGITTRKLSQIVNIPPSKLKYYLSALEGAGFIKSLKLKIIGNDRIYTIPGAELEGIVLSLLDTEYASILKLIAKEPGINAAELSLRTRMDPDKVLKFIKELSNYNIVEIKKVELEYKVYPSKTLLKVISNLLI